MTEPLDLSEIARALAVVGMTDEEAHVYLHLLQAGPSKVGQLAPYFEFSRSKLYEVLDELSQKSFVVKTPERPTVYHPVFPERAFEIGARDLHRHRQRLATVRDDLLGPLRRLHAAAEGPQPTDWTKVVGAERIHGILLRTVEEASHEILLADNLSTSVPSWQPFATETWSAIQQRLADGLEPRILLGPTDETRHRPPAWALEGARVRRLQVEHTIQFLVADQAEVVFWIQVASPGSMGLSENVAIHTDAPPVAGTHLALFNTLWHQADGWEP